MQNPSIRKNNTSSNKICTHGKKFNTNTHSQNNQTQQNLPQETTQQKVIHSSQSQSKLTENPHDTQIKQLIAMNADYFQNIIKVCCHSKPNNLKLKLPSSTGQTQYKKKYPKRAISHENPKFKFDGMNKTNLPFYADTTYTNSYVAHPLEKKQKHKKTYQNDENQKPSFMETQYHHDFLNWAGKNYVPSMKPKSNPATTELPFQGVSVYKADFNKKDAHPCPKILKQSSFPKFGNISMPSQTYYKSEFGPKQIHKDNSCKPNNVYIDNGLKLKGTTQYKTEFVGQKPHNDCNWAKKSVQDLQKLMMTL